jgi:condensin complex subunit 1
MRNGVLAAMGEILMKVLSKDDLDEKMKDTRDQFLEKLEVTTLYADWSIM